jgi:hypothetical protein
MSERAKRVVPSAKTGTAGRLIAANYPQQLNAWYLQTGRKRINSIYKIKGSQIIQMGVRAC